PNFKGGRRADGKSYPRVEVWKASSVIILTAQPTVNASISGNSIGKNRIAIIELAPHQPGGKIGNGAVFIVFWPCYLHRQACTGIDNACGIADSLWQEKLKYDL
ncbi:MAG: hypothetical protein GWN30_06335, partial [Gammaproteobacteria bacterium]|nr:hypothetical protein [Gammaproteobacteria bacterium]NIW99646.1 hypothetical protein [Phycisphaerae bacterium]